MTVFGVEFRPEIPHRLRRLAELADDLRYSWDRRTCRLFERLDARLWEAVRHNPRTFLHRVDTARLQRASEDPVYLDEYDHVLARYDAYHAVPTAEVGSGIDAAHPIAYFSAEFGFHESLQLYSGGLGILAADHCKAASDMGLPFAGVSLLYRQGYFDQQIDADGTQHALYRIAALDDIPVVPLRGDDGREIHIHAPIDDRDVAIRVWRVKVGRVQVFLLDTDVEENPPELREITYRLYGGDQVMRIRQEIVLGIGGVRALRAAGLSPAAWHINEGHAAFAVLERCREAVAGGADFESALEAVAAATVFTTHTPVPAGHDVFPEELVDAHLHRLRSELGIDRERFLSLGRKPDEGSGFNLTALAIRGSRLRNGVSRVHGRVSSRLCASLWPDVPPEENPIDHVTNGVHLDTFLAREWEELFDATFAGEWRARVRAAAFWKRLDAVPDHLFWSIRQTLKTELLIDLRHRLREQYRRNGAGDLEIERVLRFLDPGEPGVLTIGFARRFATYKRATLLLADRERLRRILCDPKRPVVMVFAGKAHPADHPGQELIRTLVRAAREPDFEGRILVVEGYDLALARKLVAGVDVWLNTPEAPLEACGTSGQKAGLNGVLNLSVLDGWWEEGFDGENGWAIRPSSSPDPARRTADDAAQLYDLLEGAIVPLYYDRGDRGYSPRWIARAKHAMATILPRFSAERMVTEYVQRFYRPAAELGRRLEADGHAAARDVARWRDRVHAAWPNVRLRRLDAAPAALTEREPLHVEVAVFLAGLRPDDVRIEIVLENEDAVERRRQSTVARVDGELDGGEVRFVAEIRPDACGAYTYRIRVVPFHPMLAHPYEIGLMRWL